MKVLLPDTIELDPRLPDGAVAYVYDHTAPIPDEHTDADMVVVWGYSRRNLEDAASRLTNVKLVQGLLAGPDSLVAAGFRDEAVIASGVGLHDVPVSEHALALLLSLVRRLPEAAAAQAAHEWSWELGGIQELHPTGRPITTLYGARVLIWGFGSIGKHLAGLLTALGADVTGVARSAGARAGYRVVDEGSLADELARTDALIMVLPNNPATVNALDAERLAQLKEHALLVNVGRGSTVDEAALLEALRGGRLGGAALDVVATEPLPADSPLWDASGVIITPHAASGRPINPDSIIEANARALVAGGELRNVVER